MARIDIHGGLEKDDFYDSNGNQIGVAEYDLNDVGVRLRVLEFADTLQPRWDDLKKRVDEIKGESMADAIARTRLESDFAEQLLADADAVFGSGFCAGALGAHCRNVLTLMEVLEGIVTKYGAQPNLQIESMVNATKNREQRRLASKK